MVTLDLLPIHWIFFYSTLKATTTKISLKHWLYKDRYFLQSYHQGCASSHRFQKVQKNFRRQWNTFNTKKYFFLGICGFLLFCFVYRNGKNSKESLWKLYVLATHVCDHIYSRSWDHDYECVVVIIERKKTQKYNTIQKKIPFLFQKTQYSRKRWIFVGNIK